MEQEVDDSLHSSHSSFREKLLEHLFIAELLKKSWKTGCCDIEVAKSEVDSKGYDLIVEAEDLTAYSTEVDQAGRKSCQPENPPIVVLKTVWMCCVDVL